MATLHQNQPLTLEFKNVSSVKVDFASIVANPDDSYAAGGVVQYSTAPVCAWCGTYGGGWGLSKDKTQDGLTLDFRKVMEQVYVVFYPTHGTSTMTVLSDMPAPAPVPLPAAGGLLGVALLGAVIWKKLAG